MKNLKERLEYHYQYFDKSKIQPDPVQYPHRFTKEQDIEIMAFIASVFAYGNVKQINSSLNKFLEIANNKPFDFISNFNHKTNVEFQHRFYSKDDIKNYFLLLNIIIEKYHSIKSFFLFGYSDKHINVKQAINSFSKRALDIFERRIEELTTGIKFFFPNPNKGSACKRINLFLRWMVRKDEIDFGLWQEIPKSKLVIPVDTHIAKISRTLKLTTVKNISWKMAEEITQNLKKFDSEDPVKYDFSLCHIGMRKLRL